MANLPEKMGGGTRVIPTNKSPEIRAVGQGPEKSHKPYRFNLIRDIEGTKLPRKIV